MITTATIREWRLPGRAAADVQAAWDHFEKESSSGRV